MVKRMKNQVAQWWICRTTMSPPNSAGTQANSLGNHQVLILA